MDVLYYQEPVCYSAFSRLGRRGLLQTIFLEMKKSRNIRIAFFVFGVVILLCSLAALVYAFGPVQALVEQVPLAPTLLTPP